jgi:hypothetical protein
MASVEVERTLVKSPPELWDEIGSEQALSRWLGKVRVKSETPPHRLEWDSDVARGIIELESSGWGTKVRAQGETDRPSAWKRMRGGHERDDEELERSLNKLLDDLGSSSLTSG